jgi:RNA polymerase sigma-70 factor (ECF subfamily)
MAENKALTEEGIIAQVNMVLRGDNTAFAPIVKNFQNTVYAIVLSQVRNPNVANEIAQDTFVKAYKYLKTFKGSSSFKTWLIRIALNNVKTHFSSKLYKQSLKSESFLTTAHEQKLANDNQYTDELLEKIGFEVSQLKDKSKEILILKFFEGLSYQEISELLDIPIGTVSSRINTALLALKAKLNEVS